MIFHFPLIISWTQSFVIRNLQLFEMITLLRWFSFLKSFQSLKALLIILRFILEYRLWSFCLFSQFFSKFVVDFFVILTLFLLSYHWRFITFSLRSSTFYCLFKVMKFLINIYCQDFSVLIAKSYHNHPFFLKFFYFTQTWFYSPLKAFEYLRRFF